MENSKDFLRLDLFSVPDLIKKKAEEELHETDENYKLSLKALKLLLRGEENLVPNTNDAFLIRFLRAKKYNCQNALLLLKKYYGHHQKYKDLYRSYGPRLLQHVMDSNIMSFLPYRTIDGCAIWVSQFGEWNPNVSSFEDNLKFGLMCMETASQYPITQISGVVNILDLQNMSYRQLFQITLIRLRCFVSGVQDSFPLRQKATHVVYEPALFSFLYRLISPLLKEKIKERIFLHGHNMNSLHQYISPEILPEKYGGTLKSFHYDQFYESVLRYENELIKIHDYGYISKTIDDS